MEQVPINPRIIAWARKRVGLSPEQLATNKIAADAIRAWEDAKSSPTEAQAEILADKLRIPLLVLFLSNPPDLDLPLKDFRTVSGESPLRLSPDFIDAANDAIARQEWFRDFQIRRGARPLPFVAQYSVNDPVESVAKDIASKLKVDYRLRTESGGWEQFLKSFANNAEALGILVMRSAIVRHATNRRLTVREFRGFAVSDKYAPLVFINDDDAKAAQTFTLAHELAHIWIGQSGISNPTLRRKASQFPTGIEQFCNQVAAEVLVPKIDFLRVWNDSYQAWTNVRSAATHFKVSTLVAIRRAYELEKIGREQFKQLMEGEYKRFSAKEEKEDEKEKVGGGNFWATFSLRNSPRLTDTIVQEVRAGRTAYSQGAYLLGVQSGTLDSYFQYLARAKRNP